MTQIPAVTDKNTLVAEFVNENTFDHFSLKFVNGNLHLDCSETHSELVSVMKIAGVCKRVNEKIDVVKIIEKMPAIAKVAKKEECWIARQFRAVIQTIHDISFPEVETRIRSGKVKFHELPFILKPGMNVIVAEEDKQDFGFGGILKRAKITEGFEGVFLQVSISVIIATTNGPVEALRTVNLPAYEGIISASKLPIHKVTDGEREALTERGKIFNKFVHKPSLTAYKGILTIPSWFGDQLLRADGRIMIDTRTFSQMEPDFYRSMIGHNFNFRDADTLEFEDADGETIEDEDTADSLHATSNTDEEINDYTSSAGQNIPEKHLWRCYHRIPGFSMRLKIWGWVDVASLKVVDWRDDAFKNLVLPNKDRVFHLVKNYGASFNDFIDDKSGGLIFLLHGPTGQGKAQPLSSIIQTPSGPKTMGDMTVGSQVFAADGSSVSVLGVYPQGVRRVYEFTFADGRKVRADENHLWQFKELGSRNKADLDDIAWDTVTTRHIFGRFKPFGAYMYVPLAKPYILPEAQLPLDPWFMGIMLCSVSSADDEISKRIETLLPSHERFVPKVYFSGSVEQRYELLRGLLDSDGTAGKDKTINFYSTSEQLAKDVQELVWGLGGIATIREKETDKRLAYNVSIRHPEPEKLFSLKRKQERVEGDHQYKDTLALRIVNVERVDDEPTQCILIDHPDHLYLTDGYVVTHNTLTAEAVAESLRRPLYSISMGELGTTVVQMEKKLRTILDLAHQWNAVLLLDEADIFMEARDTNDVERNAMVSIFLRILEYHSGVMFLTTNRVKAFDPAFFSRISMAIKYEPMTTVNRKTIWTNLLSAAKIDYSEFDLDKMAKYEINGRNMKTAVRLGQTNALGYNRPVTQDDIEEVLKSAATFNHEIGIY